MKIDSIELYQFRNCQRLRLVPRSGLNFIVGRNAQGKTSVLESVALLASLESFRTADSAQLIRTAEPTAEVRARVSHEQGGVRWESELKLVLSRSAGGRVAKSFFVNGKAVKSASRYFAERQKSLGAGFHAIVFNPADHELVHGAPSGRRRYLDQAMTAEDPALASVLRGYQRLLEQRNRLLKAASEGRVQGQALESQLLAFTDPLIQAGARIAQARLSWLARLIRKMPQFLAHIAPNQQSISIGYSASWLAGITGQVLESNDEMGDKPILYFSGQDPHPPLDRIELALRERFERLAIAERHSGVTLAGPHRDDWQFFMKKNRLQGRGSQGEVRTALLALKLSEIELYRERTGLRPLLLLDDFSSELDLERRGYLLDFLTRTDLQVFVTTTEEVTIASESQRPELFNPGLFKMENGAFLGSTKRTNDVGTEHTSAVF